MAKQTVFTQTDKAIVGALKGAPDGLTIAELKEATGLDIKSGHVVGAIKKGLIEAIGEREVFRPSTRKVAIYEFVTADVLSKQDGKAHNYTDNEKAKVSATRLNLRKEPSTEKVILDVLDKNTNLEIETCIP